MQNPRASHAHPSKRIQAYGLAALLLTMAACGGGGSGTQGEGGSTSSTIKGTVASGAPLSNAKVDIRDAKGASRSATPSETTGEYSADVSGMTPPLLLRATGKVSGKDVTYFALAQSVPSSRVLNVTPTTDALMVAMAASGPALYQNPQSLTGLDFSKLQSAQQKMQDALKSYLQAMGLPDTTDFLTTPFKADKQSGMDRLLDCLSYDPATGKMSVKGACTGAKNGNVPSDTEVFDPTSAAPPSQPPAVDDRRIAALAELAPKADAMIAALSAAASGNDISVFERLLRASVTVPASGYAHPASFTSGINQWITQFENSRLRIRLSPGSVFDVSAAVANVSLAKLDVCLTAHITSTANPAGEEVPFLMSIQFTEAGEARIMPTNSYYVPWNMCVLVKPNGDRYSYSIEDPTGLKLTSPPISQ